ncbi:tRNA uridine-5-carboxymethylaminomethyl(34) synthesis GTPase MnmE [Burkholderiaceae bacterium FT117]|uniref:tRNA uridine-5-carboxymethylaminomethyl(34) synthesis GTPase MnmE n=1 Tax=Zeimonas sediminis TaxID=2944268 RepID=UPI002342DB3F|nr:tRNA uridine-5-carboxymethylaminomethyl(34) synthesis GTPase MnmE [Zeimonas sediminis]MCM5571234.1 tRNA uridine-5-carboxymethylaminomethyl(34) synthesis GTPase MnmE [Zeimonas sediminis]
MTDNAPIAAIATAPGRGGIGVVRVSGADLRCVIDAVLGRPLSPRHATYGPFLAADGSAIDQGIAIHFPAPHSYTGEDVLELQGHGGPVVMQLLLRRVLEAGEPIGLRLAQPGEFTQRAYLNDKLDLGQAEAVADLIDASTEQAARSATRSLSGEFSKRIHALVDELVELRMLVEATLDFPEEEIDFLEAADALGRLARVRERLAEVLAEARQGALLREGLNVVLVGEPNVGKSSLLNALAGAEVAIVTPIAGTTRDRVAQAIQIEGVPVNVIDTAGLRDTQDEVERIGIARTWAEAEKADVVLHLLDAMADRDAAGEGDAAAAAAAAIAPEPSALPVARSAATIEEELARRLRPGVPVLRVFNKIDLSGDAARVEAAEGGLPERLWLSARTGEGVDLLRRELLALAGWQGAGESAFIARERHLVALRAAAAHAANAAGHAEHGNRRLDLFAEELRLAQERLNEITGEFTADDLLGVIFSRFCIGK